MGDSYGRFAWADVAVPDTDAGGAFYAKLFGWEAVATAADDAAPYTMFMLGDQPVAGMRPLRPEDAASGEPAAWSSHILVDDVEAVAARAVELGATLLMEPTDVPNAGRMIFAIDPVGAPIGFWQGTEHRGAGVFNVPGAMAWNELGCRDVGSATAFYTKLLGWGVDVQEHDGFAYTVVTVDGRPIGGIYDTTGILPDEVPANWFVWFAVADVDATAALAASLGATIEREPWDTAFGRMAVVSDPQGPAFGIVGAATTGA